MMENHKLLEKGNSENSLESCENCCDPCKCQVCLCRVSSSLPSFATNSAFYVDILARVPVIPPPLSASAPSEPSPIYLAKVEKHARRMKRIILLSVEAVTQVTEIAAIYSRNTLLLRAFTRALSSKISSAQSDKLASLCIESLLGAGYDARLKPQCTEEELQELEKQESEELSLDGKKKTFECHYETTIDIYGMTCASCVATIESILNEIDGVSECSVLLLSQKAIFKHNDRVSAHELKEEIESCGFEVGNCETSNLYQTAEASIVRLHVFGMTCASCVAVIESSLKKVEGIIDASVNLMASSAEVKVDPTIMSARQIEQIIEGLGYEAKSRSQLESSSDGLDAKINAEAAHMSRMFFLCLFFAIPTILIAMIFEMFLPSNNHVHKFFMQEIAPGLTLSSLLLLALSTPVQFYLALPFYKSAYNTMKHTFMPNMDVLIVVGTTASYFASIASLIFNIIHQKALLMTFFETSVILITFIYLGRYLEIKAKKQTTESMSNLLATKEVICHIVQLDLDSPDFKISSIVDCTSSDTRVGDLLQIPPNTNIPVDGIIIRGKTSIDESMLTGESLPVYKTARAAVYAGTLNLTSMIYIKATRVGSDTTLQKIVKMVEQAQSKKSKIQKTADFIARYFVWMVITIALVDFVIWASIGGAGLIPESWIPFGFTPILLALFFGVGVLVVACPCAIGLAIPTAVMVATGSAAKFGILIKEGGAALEKGSRITSVVFDKTGTLTMGKPTVINSFISPSLPELQAERLFSLISSLSQHSDHPLSQAIFRHVISSRKDLEIISFDNVDEIPGKGVQGKVKSESLFIGSQRWIYENLKINYCNLDEENLFNDCLHAWKEDGKSVVMIAYKSNVYEETFISAAFALADPVRDEAKQVIADLKNKNICPWIISGDNISTVLAVARQLNIPADQVIGGVLPDEKAKYIKYLQKTARKSFLTHDSSSVDDFGNLECSKSILNKGDDFAEYDGKVRDHFVVAFIGDGSNDAIGLAQADLGMSMGTGTDLALSSASVVLLSSNLRDLVSFIKLSKMTMFGMYQNLAWAFIYNSLGIPIAAGVLFPHVRLSPSLAGILMAFSSVSVVLSSLVLRARIERYLRNR